MVLKNNTGFLSNRKNTEKERKTGRKHSVSRPKLILVNCSGAVVNVCGQRINCKATILETTIKVEKLWNREETAIGC